MWPGLGDKEVIIYFLPVLNLLPGRKSLLGCLLEPCFCVHLKKLALQSLFSRNLAGEIGNEFQQRQVFIYSEAWDFVNFFLIRMYNKLCCYQALHSAFCSLVACDAYVDAVCIKMSCPNTADWGATCGWPYGSGQADCSFSCEGMEGPLKHLTNAPCANFAAALRLEILSCGLALYFL